MEDLVSRIGQVLEEQGLDMASREAAVKKIAELIYLEKKELVALCIDADNPDELINIKISECYYIDTQKRRIIYQHTNGKKYPNVHLLEDFESSSLLYREGIIRTDHSNFLNINRVTSFSKARGQAFFDADKRIAAKVASIHSPQVKENLRIRGIE
ncbi:hypothetical protein WMW72_11980 [Paenibacillus filicis]|uniref:HTH LytTR-type domain-containing protein n=1 Tax=Paenibacillus filicis TaxID=669464 RepID=A0ABU9DKL4_9BACL